MNLLLKEFQKQLELSSSFSNLTEIFISTYLKIDEQVIKIVINNHNFH